MCFICVEDELEQLAISDRVLVSKGSECCATNMLNSQPFDMIDADEDDLCHSRVENSKILSVNKAIFDEPCCKADASDNEEEGLDECGVFAIPKYQLSQTQSANDELQSLTICLQCKTAQIQSMFLPCHHIIHCESCVNSTLECPLFSQFITASIRIFVGFSLHKRQLH